MASSTNTPYRAFELPLKFFFDAKLTALRREKKSMPNLQKILQIANTPALPVLPMESKSFSTIDKFLLIFSKKTLHASDSQIRSSTYQRRWLMARQIDFKTSVATAVSGLDVTSKKLHDLVGREKPAGQHHMRYTPADMRVARYRAAGVEPPASSQTQLNLVSKLPPVIVTRMTKGGVGKTSVSVNIAASLAMSGFRVLMIDADPQASASNLLGIETSSLESDVHHIGEFLKRSSSTPDPDLRAAIRHIYDGGFLDLIPSDITLAETDASLVAVMSSHTRAELFLNRNADFFGQTYDVIVVDTAPGTTPIGLAFSYAAKASGKVLTVVEPEGSCLRALDSLASNLAEIKAVTGAAIGMEVVVNKYHPSLKHVRESMGFLYSKYGAMLNDSIIPQFSGFARQLNPGDQAPAPLVEAEPSSVGAAAIIDVAKSLILSFGITQPGLPAQKS